MIMIDKLYPMVLFFGVLLLLWIVLNRSVRNSSPSRLRKRWTYIGQHHINRVTGLNEPTEENGYRGWVDQASVEDGYSEELAGSDCDQHRKRDVAAESHNQRKKTSADEL